MARTANMPRSRTFYSFYTDYPEKGVTTTSYNAFNIFECEERIEPIDWKYLDGDSVILGHDCLKAEGMFRGHKWTVWFTPDVPMEYGPWKLRGLPGLILYAEHDSGFFKYEAIELGKCEGLAMFHQNDKKPIKSTAKEIQELDALNYKNTEAFFERCGMPKPLNIDLKKLPSETPIFMEKYE
jgi:GLPGLI family protein